MINNKSTLLTILGVALLGASKKKEKGSSSNIELMLKLGGYSDGKIRVVTKVVYDPYCDWRNQSREPEHYFDLHEYINPAIDAVVDLKQYAIENNEELEDEVDLDVIDVETYYYDDEIFDTYDLLPKIEDQVDVSGIESVSYHDWDIFEMIREEEGLDEIDDIPHWMYEDRVNRLIDDNAFTVEFIFDPAKNPEIMHWQETGFKYHIERLMEIAYNLYLGGHNAGRDGDNCKIGKVVGITVNFISKGRSSSELRKF